MWLGEAADRRRIGHQPDAQADIGRSWQAHQPLMADSRRLWRQQLQGISRESPLK